VANLVAGFHALGTLLAVGLMILPAATARLWCVDMTAMIAVAMATSVAASLAGLSLSYNFGWPTGPTIILAAGAVYAVSLVFGRAGGMRRGRAHGKGLRQ